MSGVDQVVAALRKARDLLPTRTVMVTRCGNLPCPSSGSGHERCGQPAEWWSQDAWDIEFLARRIEQAEWASS